MANRGVGWRASDGADAPRSSDDLNGARHIRINAPNRSSRSGKRSSMSGPELCVWRVSRTNAGDRRTLHADCGRSPSAWIEHHHKWPTHVSPTLSLSAPSVTRRVRSYIAAHIGTGEVRPSKKRAEEVDVGHIGVGEVDVSHTGTTEVGAAEVGIGEVGTAEVGATGKCAGEVSPNQVGVDEVGATKMYTRQVQTCHVRGFSRSAPGPIRCPPTSVQLVGSVAGAPLNPIPGPGCRRAWHPVTLAPLTMAPARCALGYIGVARGRHPQGWHP